MTTYHDILSSQLLCPLTTLSPWSPRQSDCGYALPPRLPDRSPRHFYNPFPSQLVRGPALLLVLILIRATNLVHPFTVIPFTPPHISLVCPPLDSMQPTVPGTNTHCVMVPDANDMLIKQTYSVYDHPEVLEGLPPQYPSRKWHLSKPQLPALCASSESRGVSS